AERNLAALERHEADYVVTSCATCGGALSRFYPLVAGKKNPELRERLDRLAKKSIDISVLLQKLGFDPATATREPSGLPSAGSRSLVPGPRAVTWHDPCHLRTHGITRQPRELLKGTPGVELREMAGADRCCGLGGTFNVYHYDASMGINAGKTASILRTGADAAVTGCPGCIMQLSDGLKQQGSALPVVHLVEVLAQGLQQSR
ncbi:MAG TPA: (Fe-S)-binding protein, partial [Verrucomicrobiae bacterium]|nr:(Fe-S)-binding protein [Verrucomicrobiae bacterium]